MIKKSTLIFPVLFVFILIKTILGNINLVHNLKLNHNQLVYNYRFVFSDFKEQNIANKTDNILQNAFANVDVKIVPHNIQRGIQYKFYAFLADYNQAVNAATLLEIRSKQGSLRHSRDIDEVLRPFIPYFPIYNSVIIENNDQEYFIQKSSKIQTQGVYYMLFIYAKNKAENDENQMGDESLFKDPSDLNLNSDYVVLSGTITYKNSNGYLDSERLPLLQFYTGSFFILMVIGLIWQVVCIKHKNNLIFLHHFLSVILTSQFIQAGFMIGELTIQNSRGDLNYSFIVFNILFSVIRNTYARVLTLLVALGFGIVLTPQEVKQKYRSLILTLSGLYFVSNTAYLIALYYNQIATLSHSIQLGVSLPLSATNTFFFYWIMLSLQKIIKELSDKKQTVKLDIMKKFSCVLLFSFLIAFFGVLAELYFKFQGDKKTMWKYEWLVESFWFNMFSVFLVMMMILMRPNEKSRLLALVHQLGDENNETGTRRGEGGAEQITDQPDEENSIELSNLSTKKKQKSSEVRRLNNNFMASDQNPNQQRQDQNQKKNLQIEIDEE
ncbi:transmembrane protein 87b [Stylonychia lemnae]|uniref:Transmembrane protein 87b n=1 Tax=Stylonychia lemnae TaxID=5949 RepID=A0A078BBN2_STYLE|nr:transmembrane protein 87b [Stylonychia lemnae]|eukprot:CDW90978.1 transmembrane protein 87b [Stylonychia lemnae]